jgi:hypothetical protein
MNRIGLVLACAITLAAAHAFAEPTFSVDFQGPTASVPPLLDGFFGVPITEGDILTTAPPGPPGPNPPLPGPLPSPGIEVGALAGAVGAVPGGLGIVPGAPGLVELDALSYGRDQGIQLYFSVDEHAFGVPSPLPPNVTSDGAGGPGEASADVFTYLGAVVPTPPGPVVGNTTFFDGDGLAPPGLPGVGFIEPNPPSPFFIPDGGDNLDAVDVDTTFADLGGLIFFSLDSAFADPLEVAPANSATAVGNLASGADVLVSTAGGLPAVAIPAFLLGLDLLGFDTDDLDALIFNDADGTASLTPPDTIYFSVRRGSAVIGAPDSAFGVAIEPGDILTLPTAAGLPPALFIAAEALGLGTARSGSAGPFGSDELDALDLNLVPVPALAPVSLLALGGGLIGLVAWAASRRRLRAV